ncbi:unnamed protein product, partial [Ectocarpus sp. 13 AM-2016]
MNVLRGAKNYVTGALGFSSGETSGALDIMVVQHEDGVMSCTPFHVRFAKVHVTSSRERVIQLRVNGRVAPLCMKLGAAGEAFFVERVHNPLRRDLATSPLASPLPEGRIDAEAADSNGDRGGQWDEESGAQDNWESRVLRNYQLLSDLSSDDEAASHRESAGGGAVPPPSSSAQASHLREGGSSRSRSPRQTPSASSSSPPPPLVRGMPPSMAASSSSSGIPAASPPRLSLSTTDGEGGGGNRTHNSRGGNSGSSGSGSISSGDRVGGGNDGGGDGASQAASCLPHGAPAYTAEAAAGTTAVAVSAPVAVDAEAAETAIVAVAGGGKDPGSDGITTPPTPEPAAPPTAAAAVAAADGRGTTHREDSKAWSDGDGDEEDNADGSDDEAEHGGGGDGGRRGGADGSGRGEAREGEEGSWWWSWTWGALPVRRKPKSGRRKHNARRARGRRATSDMDESCLASVASVEEAGGARMTRASTAAESSTGTPWPSSPPSTAAAVMSRVRSLQDHLGGGSGSGSGDEEPTAVAWAIGAEEISGSSGGEGGGGGGVTTGSRAGGGGERAPPLTQDTGLSPTSTFRGNEGGGGALAVAPCRPAPGIDAGGAGQTGSHHPPSTGGGERQDAPVVDSRAPLAKPIPPASSGGDVFVAAGVGTGASLSADPSAAGERGAADAAAGQPQAPSTSPWIGRGGSDDGGSDDDGGGGESPSPPPAAVAVHPPQGVASGGEGHDGETEMRICVTDVLLETEESESPCLPQPPGEGGELRHPSLLQALAPAPAALRGDALPAAAEGGGVSRAHEDEPRGMDEGGGPPSSPGETAAAVTTTKREPEAVRVSDGDHLALAHLLLRAREDSSCLPSHREDQEKGVDPLPPATAAGPPVAGSGVRAAEAGQTSATPSSQEPGPAALAAAPSLPPQGCIFPGDVESEMNQEVVAIETLSADAEAWLTGEPASGGEEMAAQRVIVASASGSSLGDKPRSRHGSNVDLKGFHTPHGGSSTDLTELSPATERGPGEAGVDCLLAAVTGAATKTAIGVPDDDGGGASREGWGQPRSPPREGGIMPPGGWSVGPQSPSGASAVTRGGSTAPSGGRRAAAAAAEGDVFLGEPGQSATGGEAGLRAAGPPRRTAPSSPPVMSLSGHLIGPEVRRGQGSGEVNKWARDAFLKEAVTWEDFSRYPQEIVQDPRLLVAVEGQLLSLSEALPHLIAASVFGNSLPQPSVARGEAPRRGSHSEASTAAGRSGGGDCDGGGGGTDGDREEAGRSCAQDGSTGGGSSSVLAQDLGGGMASRGAEAVAAAGAGAGEAYGGGGAASDVGGTSAASDGTMAGPEEAEEAAGGYWGLSGWFSRRSGMSPPLPMGEEPVAGLVSDQRLSMAGSDGRASWSRKGGGATVAAAAAGGGKAAGSGRRVRRGSWRGSPSPLSIEVVGVGELQRSRDAGDVSESDEDEDLYGKTLRPTSEQLVS